MGRAIIGKSKGDVAFDKMNRFLEKSAAQREKTGYKAPREPNLFDSIKRDNPTTWKTVLAEIKLEKEDAEYRDAKRNAYATAKERYWSQPRRERLEGPTEQRYIATTVKEWQTAYLKERGIDLKNYLGS